MHLIDDLLRAISDELALAVAWAVTLWHWLVGDMAPISAFGAVAALILTVAKIAELRRRRKDMLFLREAFEAAELEGDNQARSLAARLMQERMNSRRGGL